MAQQRLVCLSCLLSHLGLFVKENLNLLKDVNSTIDPNKKVRFYLSCIHQVQPCVLFGLLFQEQYKDDASTRNITMLLVFTVVVASWYHDWMRKAFERVVLMCMFQYEGWLSYFSFFERFLEQLIFAVLKQKVQKPMKTCILHLKSIWVDIWD